MNRRYARRSEDTEQMSVMDWARWNQNVHPELELLHHCPNGGSRNKAEGFNVTEQYFTCQECGKKYTVLIVDHEMQFLIQKRQQVERQIKLHRQIRSRAQTIQRLITKIEKIKKQQEERMIMLKEQYKEEIGS